MKSNLYSGGTDYSSLLVYGGAPGNTHEVAALPAKEHGIMY
jgi:hypothetical protein